MEYREHFATILDWRSTLAPDNIAFEFVSGNDVEGPTLTYKELADRAKAIAAAIQRHGGSDQHIIIVLPPGLGLVASIFAGFYCNSVVTVQEPPRKKRARDLFRSVKSQIPAKIIITDSSGVDSVLSELDLCEIINIDDVHSTSTFEYVRPERFTTDKPSFIQFSSGTTGTPKGVVLSQNNLTTNSLVIQQSFFNTSKSLGFIWLPPYHDMGLIGGILQPMWSGFPTILAAPTTFLQDPLRWLRIISHRGITVTGGPNFAYELLCKKLTQSSGQSFDLSRWQVAFCGAEPVRASTYRKVCDAFAQYGFSPDRFLPCYGLAEATLFVTGTPKRSVPTLLAADAAALRHNRFQYATGEHGDARYLLGCGFSQYGHVIKIADPETCNVLKHNEIGEIWLSSPSNALGYWQNGEVDQTLFQHHLSASPELSFFRTGDLGFIHQNELFIIGRLKDVFIENGRNFNLNEIEELISHSFGGNDEGRCLALVIEEADREALLIVYETAKAGEKKQIESIISTIQMTMFDHFHINPDQIVLVRHGDIPSGRTGKMQRMAAKEKYAAGKFNVIAQWNFPDRRDIGNSTRKIMSSEEFQHAINTKLPIPLEHFSATKKYLQQWLIETLSEISPIQSIDTNLHFGLYGFDSVDSVTIVEKLKAQMPSFVDIPDTILWDFPNLEALSQHLAEHIFEAGRAEA